MKQELLLVGSDGRQAKLAASLQARGWKVLCHQVAQHPDDFFVSSPFDDVAAVLLPVPALTPAGMIRGTDAPAVSFRSLLRTVPKPIPIFGGLLPDCPEDASRLTDLAKDPVFAMENAALTAEGAIRLLMDRIPPVTGRRILVIGYGRIGTFLAKQLTGLGAAVSLRVRRPEIRMQCAMMGYPAEAEDPKAYDAVINTVPAPVLTGTFLAGLRPDCVLLDLASAPGGLEAGSKPLQPYLPASGLPNRYCPDRAADVLGRAVLRAMEERRIG